LYLAYLSNTVGNSEVSLKVVRDLMESSNDVNIFSANIFSKILSYLSRRTWSINAFLSAGIKNKGVSIDPTYVNIGRLERI